MTIKELIAELNELVTEGTVNENTEVVNAELDNIFSVVESIDGNQVVIYF